MQLPLSIVQKEYPETTAIKYRLTGGNWRMLILEQDHFHPPEDGWGDREYEIVNQTKNPNHSTVIREENSVNPSRPRQTYNHQSYPQQTSILQIAHQCVQPNQQIRPLMGISPYSPFYTPPRYSLPNHTFSRFQSFMNKWHYNSLHIKYLIGSRLMLWGGEVIIIYSTPNFCLEDPEL